MPGTSVRNALDAAQHARQIAHDYQHAHRDSDSADQAIATRGTELRRLADEATVISEEMQRAARTVAATARRAEKLAEDAGLQGRLRAETQARRDAAAPTGSHSAAPEDSALPLELLNGWIDREANTVETDELSPVVSKDPAIRRDGQES